MSKYLKLLLINASYLILSAFVVNAQPADDAESTSGDTGTAPAATSPAASSDASAAPAAAPTASAAAMVTGPSAPAPAISSAVESNTLVTAVQAGLDIADAVALGSSNIKKLVVKDGDFAGASVTDIVKQFKTRAKVVKVYFGSGESIDTLVAQIRVQKKDAIIAFADLTVAKLTEYKDSAVDSSTSISERFQEIGVKAIVRKANVDAGYPETEADDIAKNITKEEREEFATVKLDDLKKATKKNKDDGKSAKDGHIRNKQAAKYTKKGGDFNTATDMSDDDLEASSNKSEDDIKNDKGKTAAQIKADAAAAALAAKKAEDDAAAAAAAALAAKKAEDDAAAAAAAALAAKKAEDDAAAAAAAATAKIITDDAAAVASTDDAIEVAGTAVQKEASISYQRLSRNTALRNAVDVAEILLTPQTISTSLDDVAETTVAKLSGSGYNTELIRILAKYGALGGKGSTLADSVLGADFKAFDKSINLSSLVQPSTDAYQQFLTDLGARSFGVKRTNNDVHEAAVSVKTSNITLGTGSDITFSSGATIDVSSKLPKGDERRIAVVGAAKDMTIKGDLTFKNTNTSENSALVLGAADQLFLRSTESTANNADYSDNTPGLTIKNEGANLALGAEKTMKLINVSITTGGNLAIGTLNDLHIGTSTNTDPTKNKLSVGNGGHNSDPDNIYMYAHNLIQINGLEITGRVDDVYMEAATINLNNVVFPNTAEVTLRSQNGAISFSSSPTNIHLGVNFNNVIHKAVSPTEALKSTDFNGIDGHHFTTKNLPNGTPAVQVKKF